MALFQISLFFLDSCFPYGSYSLFYFFKYLIKLNVIVPQDSNVSGLWGWVLLQTTLCPLEEGHASPCFATLREEALSLPADVVWESLWPGECEQKHPWQSP